MTESKPSTASDTDTAKTNRWHRATSIPKDEIDQLLDLYWGGKERRITGMTLRIMGVNALAVIGLLISIVYMGQYHTTLIEAKLKQFASQTLLVGAAITEAVDGDDGNAALSEGNIGHLVGRFSSTLDRDILVFNSNNMLSINSSDLVYGPQGDVFSVILQEDEDGLKSVQVLKSIIAFTARLLPKKKLLQPYHENTHVHGDTYFDVKSAWGKSLSMSAWRASDGDIILTAAVPIIVQEQVKGVVYIINDRANIQQEINDMWYTILKILCVVLLFTMVLSIYLSGVIARPLRKLADAAEKVRNGAMQYGDIPDMSDRRDEVGELSVVLRNMTQALGERMDTIESFAADVAHELKNPLTSLKSAVETAAIVKTAEDRDTLLAVIRHDIERMDRIISDVSRASRLDAELSRERFKAIDAKLLIDALIDGYRLPLDRGVARPDIPALLGDKRVWIINNAEAREDAFVHGNESRLLQVLENVFANAMSFSPQDGRIVVDYTLAKRRLILTIDDDGVGIPENKLETVFDRFYSERPASEAYGRHSGLGLSICKQIITAHNGRITAENRYDDAGAVIGARFTITLNLSKPQAE